jgi:hypothetical protein
VSDLNGDLKPDLAVSNFDSNNVSILLATAGSTPAIPEVPSSILLPLMGIAAAGLILMWKGRRLGPRHR